MSPRKIQKYCVDEETLMLPVKDSAAKKYVCWVKFEDIEEYLNEKLIPLVDALSDAFIHNNSSAIMRDRIMHLRKQLQEGI